MKVLLNWGYFTIQTEGVPDEMWLESFIKDHHIVLANEDLETVIIVDDRDEYSVNDYWKNKDSLVPQGIIFGFNQY